MWWIKLNIMYISVRANSHQWCSQMWGSCGAQTHPETLDFFHRCRNFRHVFVRKTNLVIRTSDFFVVCHLRWWHAAHFRNELAKYEGKCVSDPNNTSRPAIAGNPRCKNITAKSAHLTSLYHMALTSTNDHLSVLRHYVCTWCKIMQHVGVNFGGIWSLNRCALGNG